MKETRVFKSTKNVNKSETPLGTSNSSQINQASHSDSNFQSNISDTKQSPKEHIVPPVINPILKDNTDKESANNKTVSLKEVWTIPNKKSV
jgi:hypothetical protein